MDQYHDTALALGLGLCGRGMMSSGGGHGDHRRQREAVVEPSLTLSISDEGYGTTTTTTAAHSGVSTTTVKREKEVMEEEEEAEVERVNNYSSRTSDEDDDGNPRKKLRLTKEQSAFLEDRFKEHSTLNPKQKQALAKQLNLRPRQVEVWFQNRRARTKLKQTEVDCEFLKRCCETLTEENRRLQKEVSELRAMKFSPAPLYMQLPAATLTMCPSCERVAADGGAKGVVASAGPNFVVAAAPKPHFFNPFTHSATC